MFTTIITTLLSQAIPALKKYWLHIITILLMLLAYYTISSIVNDNKQLKLDLKESNQSLIDVKQHLEQTIRQSITDSQLANERLERVIQQKEDEQRKTLEMINNEQGRNTELANELRELHEQLKTSTDLCVNATMPDPIIRMLFNTKNARADNNL